MSSQDKLRSHILSGAKDNSSKSSGTLAGEITNLITGIKYEVTSGIFYRFTGDYPRVAISGADPEGDGNGYEINMHFLENDPPSGTYTVGGDNWKGCSYSRWPDEQYFFAESGELRLLNFESVTTLEGELSFVTHVGNQRQYKVDVTFKVVGW